MSYPQALFFVVTLHSGEHSRGNCYGWQHQLFKEEKRHFCQFKVPFALFMGGKECVVYHYLYPIVRDSKVQFLWGRKIRDGEQMVLPNTHATRESKSVEICWPQRWLLVAVAEDDEDGCCCCVVCWVAYSSAQTRPWRRLSTCLMALGDQWGRQKSAAEPLISLHSATVRRASSYSHSLVMCKKTKKNKSLDL